MHVPQYQSIFRQYKYELSPQTDFTSSCFSCQLCLAELPSVQYCVPHCALPIHLRGHSGHDSRDGGELTPCLCASLQIQIKDFLLIQFGGSTQEIRLKIHLNGHCTSYVSLAETPNLAFFDLSQTCLHAIFLILILNSVRRTQTHTCCIINFKG